MYRKKPMKNTKQYSSGLSRHASKLHCDDISASTGLAVAKIEDTA